MDWKRAMEEERAALMRIVALVLALADLAELACARSPAICGFVFWILRPAEPVVCAFVTNSTDALPEPLARSADVRADLMHLAARFRELAREVKRQARSTFSPRDRDAGSKEPFPHRAGRMLWIIDAIKALDFIRPSLAPDTS